MRQKSHAVRVVYILLEGWRRVKKIVTIVVSKLMRSYEILPKTISIYRTELFITTATLLNPNTLSKKESFYGNLTD